ncbi:hypothetical protein [Microbacterium halotolerans]|uniref:hypothetical protein n=1 Tax=Microbacterium halotolerans TaxID=246613 RepID=UPI000E6A9E1F|nr:hypothetical protein [Microbacterium halotolerans]
MSDKREPGALRYARRLKSRRDLRLSQIEYQIATDVPAFRARLEWATFAPILGVILTVMTFGAVATIGPQGAIPGIVGTTGLSSAPMDDELRDVLMPLSFFLGIAGLLVFLVEWKRLGRTREGVAIIVAAIALITDVAILNWFFSGEGEGLLAFVLACVNGLLAVAVIIIHAFVSPGGSAEVARHEQVADLLRTLPDDEQRRALDERAEALSILVERGMTDGRVRSAADALPLGELWTAERKHRGKRRR